MNSQKLTSSPTNSGSVLNRFAVLGPLAPAAFVFIVGLIILAISRSALTFMYFDRLRGASNIFFVYIAGMRMDVILLSYATIFPTFLLLLCPKRIILKFRWFFTLWFTLFMCLLVHMEIATFPFVAEYDLRPDRKFLEYLKHTREVSGMLWKAYKFHLIGGVFFVALTALLSWISVHKVITNYKEFGLKTRLVLLPLITALLVLGARSTLGHRPANLSTASFSNNHLLNEFALNSTYSMLYAAYRMSQHERNPSAMYGRISEENSLARVRSKTLISKEDFIPSEIPMLHKQRSPFKRKRPLNVVVFLQ